MPRSVRPDSLYLFSAGDMFIRRASAHFCSGKSFFLSSVLLDPLRKIFDSCLFFGHSALHGFKFNVK